MAGQSWVRRVTWIVCVVAGTSVLAGCTGSGGPGGGGTPGGASTSAPTGTLSPGGTPAPGPTSTTGDTGTPPPPGSAQAYAQAAMDAWRTGDHTRLAQLDGATDTVFVELDGGDFERHFTVYQCSGAAGSSICAGYNRVGDELDLRLRNDLIGTPHAIIDGHLLPITFPADQKVYAQEALDAWLKHNSAAVSLLTGKPGDSAFTAVPDARRGDPWTYDHTESGSGHQFYLWTNPAGDTIIISMAIPGFITPPPNRHGLIEAISYHPHP
jgi:hypothetical protein